MQCGGREAASKKIDINKADIEHCHSAPVTILAVDAPDMKGQGSYRMVDLGMLARKILLIYELADKLDTPVILIGLIGGGA